MEAPTVAGLLDRSAAADGSREAVVFDAFETRLSYAELVARTRRAARALVARGIGKGDRVAVWSTNRPEWIVLQFALARVGAILVTVNTALKSRELEYVLARSRARVLFLSAGTRDLDFRQIFAAVEPKPPTLERVVFLGDDDPALLTWREFCRAADEVDDDRVSAIEAGLSVDEPINMQYTSGTTGFPKGVLLSHRNIVTNAIVVAESLGLEPDDRVLMPVPLFHCFGCVISVLGTLGRGATLVGLPAFEPVAWLEAAAAERCTVAHGVPTMFRAVLDHPERDRYGPFVLRTGIMAGAMCPADLMRRVIDELGVEGLTIAYGLTECSPGVTFAGLDETFEVRTTTVGRPLPGVEVRITDPTTLAPLDPGRPGELWVRGHNVMLGYDGDPEATAAVITGDGWLRTGDLATRDEGGCVRIVGRLKELIIRGGENIAPAEVEDVLRAHPAVAEAAVFAIADEKYGEVPVAAVGVRPGELTSEQALRDHCAGHLARFKVPVRVHFVEIFPLTPSGKIQKFVLAEMFAPR